MVTKLPDGLPFEVTNFLEQLRTWARGEPDLIAIALVGSQARGEATPESDIDLVLIFTDPEPILIHRDWISIFGQPDLIEVEHWGKVTALRVSYAHGLEVEFGVTAVEWGADPEDEGDGQVIRDGLMILFERSGHLSRKLKRFLS